MVDEAAARRLIESQFPDLRPRRLELLGEGWDMTVWSVDAAHVFRFPRREVVVPGLLRELRVLPVLAPALPLPIPVPAYAGRPDSAYPWPFYGAPLIPGREVGQAGLGQAERDALGAPLGEFLRGLHRLPRLDLPEDPMGRADMAVRVPRAREVLSRLATAGVWPARGDAEAVLKQAERLERDRQLVVVHGDLHLRHLLVDGGRAAGVIDWIDVCLAPPAVDLVLYWCMFSAAGRREFEAAYGEIDGAALLRARALSLNLCGILAEYAHSEGVAWLLDEAVAGLDRTLA